VAGGGEKPASGEKIQGQTKFSRKTNLVVMQKKAWPVLLNVLRKRQRGTRDIVSSGGGSLRLSDGGSTCLSDLRFLCSHLHDPTPTRPAVRGGSAVMNGGKNFEDSIINNIKIINAETINKIKMAYGGHFV
jgi:hypothetical protein